LVCLTTPEQENQLSATLDHQARLGPPTVEEVSPDVFAYIQPDGSWWINNTGFLVGSPRVVAIDTCATEARSRAFQAAIHNITDRPVQTLTNTHHHGDHTHGNYLFDTATIVAHERCREEILAEGPPATAPVAASGAWDGPEWGHIEIAPLFLTYTDTVKVYVDDLRCEVSYIGTPAHSTNDSIIWIPERSVLFAGDLLFNGGTPFLLAGSIAGALKAVASLKQFKAETIVPGHGPTTGPAVIDDVLGYLQFVSDLARNSKAAGLTPLQAAQEADLGRFAELSDTERTVGNLHRAYAELDGAEPGAKINIRSAIEDMVTYNGGKPLTCLA